TALGLAANPPGEPTWVGTQFSLQLFRAVGVGDTVVADAREEHGSRRRCWPRRSARARRPPRASRSSSARTAGRAGWRSGPGSFGSTRRRAAAGWSEP
ncbi:MAG TPA: hypothetical protein VFN44_21635, partial [Solirubrobacteraceae bacterium]|nr:hypothetical protein [Solirubrobacteraceae bacterium]